MADLLVRLYALPPLTPLLERMQAQSIVIRPALAPELFPVTAWVRERFGAGWAGECQAGFARQPISCLLALRAGTLLGFACYDVTSKGFFGPTGVDQQMRGGGVGTALLLAALHALHAQGYAYAIIGDAGPVEFYQRTVRAIVIPDSEPGIYQGMLEAGDAHP